MPCSKAQSPQALGSTQSGFNRDPRGLFFGEPLGSLSFSSGSGSGMPAFRHPFRSGVSMAFARPAFLFFSALACPPRSPFCELTLDFAAAFRDRILHRELKIPSSSVSKYSLILAQTLGQLRPHRAMRCRRCGSLGRLAPFRCHWAMISRMYAPTSLASRSRVSASRSPFHKGMKGRSLMLGA